MPQFNYQSLDQTGSIIEGKLEADNEFAAVARIRGMGYTPLDITEVKESSLKTTFRSRRKVKIGDLGFFSRQLAAMLTAGIPLTRCLYTLNEQTSSPELARSAGEVARKVEGGISFSEALSAHPEIYPPMYIEMVKAGELSGSLNEILLRLSDQLQKDKQLRDSIRSATFYPTVVLIFAGLVVLAMMWFIVPVFKGFIPASTVLPLPTKVVFLISETLHSHWYLYILALLLLVLAVKIFVSSDAGLKTWEQLKYRLPVFGELLKKATVARFCRTLATLLAGGIPVLQALESAGPASGSKQVTEAIKMVSTGIQEGQSIAMPLKKSGFFPPMVINMIAVGEETGQISTLLSRVADFYEEEVTTMTKGLTAMLEPLLLIVVGITIGAVVIAIYLPIFTVVTSTGR